MSITSDWPTLGHVGFHTSIITHAYELRQIEYT